MPSLVGVSDVDPVIAHDENPTPSRYANIATRGFTTDPSIAHDESDNQLQVVNFTDKKAPKAMKVVSNDQVASPAFSSTPKSNQRKVTPHGDSASKQVQQKKVNQMSLSSFFLSSGNKGSATTPPSTVHKRATTTIDQTCSVLDQLSPPRKRPLNISSKSCMRKESISSSDNINAIEANEMERKLDTNAPADKIVTDDQSKCGEKSQDKGAGIDCSNDSNETRDEGTNIDEKTEMSTNINPKPPEEKVKSISEPFKNLTEEELSEDRRTLHKKYRAMKQRYLKRAAELISQAKTGIEDETFHVPNLEQLGNEESLHDDDFPARVVSNMALLIEGRYF
jgi:hypothetical protein